MYYTCTVNPAVDYFLQTDILNIGTLNRVDSGKYHLGGKGIIVSRVLNILNAETTTLGFAGGFTGQYIKSELTQSNIQHHFIDVNEPIRINIIVTSTQGETTLNTAGPTIDQTHMQTLIDYIENTLTPSDTFFLCGNKAKGMATNDYFTISDAVNKTGARLIVDSNTELLLKSLPAHPFLIKPNHIELNEITHIDTSTVNGCIEGAHALQALGATNVLVSRGKHGAVYVPETGEVITVNVAKTTPGKQTIGAGDTMLASFVFALDQFQDIPYALRFASAAGGATVEGDDLLTIELLNTFLEQVSTTTV